MATTMKILVVGGGGGGGSKFYSNGGGGGGQVIYNAAYAIAPGTYNVTVGMSLLFPNRIQSMHKY